MHLLNVTAEIVREGVWLSDAGVTATMHYDTYHNVFVQLAGRKHFVLFPSHLHAALSLFPSLHPGKRRRVSSWLI